MDLAKPREDAEKLKICNNPKQMAITKRSQVSKNLVKNILKKYNIYVETGALYFIYFLIL